MQIEGSFRDLKSHHYGRGFEDSLTRKGVRLEILILVRSHVGSQAWGAK
jgi:hypothetical protein